MADKTPAPITPGTDSFHLGVMATLALCRVYTSNIHGYIEGPELVIRDMNQSGDKQIVFATVAPPLAYESQIQQVKDSYTAARIIDFLKQSGRLNDAVPQTG